MNGINQHSVGTFKTNSKLLNQNEQNSFTQRETIITVQSGQQNQRDYQTFNKPFSYQQPQEIQSSSISESNQILQDQIQFETSSNFEQVQKQIENNEQKDLIFTAAQKRKILIDKRYIDQLQQFDQLRENDCLVSYFCTIGMDEADILHNIMNIKEIEKYNSGLNQYQFDDMIANPEVLTGERAYNSNEQKTNIDGRKSFKPFAEKTNTESENLFQPSFYPQVISQVPKVNRSQLLFPINLADFVYPQGVQVMSANQVIHLKKNHESLKNQYKYNPFQELLPILYTHINNKQFEFTFDSGIEKEIMLSNQEGKIYYATCYDYFIDLKSLNDEFLEQGKFQRYTNSILSKILEADETDQQELELIKQIIQQEIPFSTYFLPFTMCIISTQSYKKQFLIILDRLYKKYVTCQLKTSQAINNKLSLEQAINRIVFGIPTPSNQFNYLKKNRIESNNFVKVKLSDVKDDVVIFKNKDSFELNHSQLENLCVLFCKLPSENILQLFKRILFNTCTIISSNDHFTSEKCIQGIMQLFYPLKTGITCVPSLIQSKLEYVKLCNQSVIGVQKKISSKIYQRNASKGIIQSQIQTKKENKLQTQYTTNDIYSKCSEEIKKKKHDKDVLQLHYDNDIGSDQYQRIEKLEKEESKWQDKLFDIMQDNSCLIALKNKKHHPLQKPIQSICFNSKGKLSYGQGAAQKGQRKQKNIQAENVSVDTTRPENRNGNLYNYGGVTETLNDVELPSEHVQKIKDLIQDAQKLNSEIWLEKNTDLINYIENIRNQKDIQENDYIKIQKRITNFLMKIKEIRKQFFLMIQSILRFYIINKDILYKFKGMKTESGHMKIYLAWQTSMDIFQLIDRSKFKQYLKERGGETQFFKKLIYYPSLQNFICDKFFPMKYSDNLRQLLVIKDHNQIQDFNFFSDQHIKIELKALVDSNKNIDLFAYQLGEELKENQEIIQKRMDKQNEEQYLNHNLNKESLYFPRYLNQDEIKRDFLDNYNQNKDKYNKLNPESLIKELLKNDRQFQELAPIHDIQYRMASQLLYFNPIVDLIVSWLLLFLGSIDYLTDPILFMKLSEQRLSESQEQYKPPEYYQSQRKQNIWLGYLLQKSLRMLINKGDYEFNPKCPLLALLFQYTHKNYYLHQKLMEVVNEDIDQQQCGGQANSGITVSSQFVLYQIHWSEKQIYNKGKIDNYNIYSKNKYYNPYQEWQLNQSRTNKLQEIQDLESIQFKKDYNSRNDFNQKVQELDNKNRNSNFNNQQYDKKQKRENFVMKYINKFKIKKQNYDANDTNEKEYDLYQKICDELDDMKLYQIGLQEQYINNNQNMQTINEEQKSNYIQLQNVDLRKTNISEDISPMIFKNDIQNENKIVFNDLSDNQKSFFSLSQIKQSQFLEITEGNEGQTEDHQLLIDLVDVKCKNCGEVQQFVIEQLMKNECVRCKNLLSGKIQIQIKSKYGVFLIKTANLIFPKRIRSEVESLLKMDVDKSYRILHQIDLSAFSQSNKSNDTDLYWSLVFWFMQNDLPYQWLAPFSAHLQEYQKPDNYPRQSQIQFESCKRVQSIGDEDMTQQILQIFKNKLSDLL